MQIISIYLKVEIKMYWLYLRQKEKPLQKADSLVIHEIDGEIPILRSEKSRLPITITIISS